MTEDIYLNHDRYIGLVEALAALEPCPFAGRVTPDQIKVALGEHGDIWPLKIRGDVFLATFEHAEKQKLTA